MDIHQVAARQRRVALLMTTAQMALFVGFLMLVLYAKPLLGTVVADHMTFGLYLGVALIVAVWLLCCAYVVWANRYHDPAAARLKAGGSVP